MMRHTNLDDPARCTSTRRAALLVLLSSLGGACLLAAASAPATDPGRDVRDHGAKGDGRADDTAAIQKAVDGRSGRVVFRKGIYRITRPIVVDSTRWGSPRSSATARRGS